MSAREVAAQVRDTFLCRQIEGKWYGLVGLRRIELIMRAPGEIHLNSSKVKLFIILIIECYSVINFQDWKL